MTKNIYLLFNRRWCESSSEGSTKLHFTADGIVRHSITTACAAVRYYPSSSKHGWHQLTRFIQLNSMECSSRRSLPDISCNKHVPHTYTGSIFVSPTCGAQHLGNLLINLSLASAWQHCNTNGCTRCCEGRVWSMCARVSRSSVLQRHATQQLASFPLHPKCIKHHIFLCYITKNSDGDPQQSFYM